METTFNISVPVDRIEIVDLPGIGTFQDPEVDDQGMTTIYLTLRTPASARTFRRKVRVEAHYGSITFAAPNPENPDPHDAIEGVDGGVVWFMCWSGDQAFNCAYDYVNQIGGMKPWSFEDLILT